MKQGALTVIATIADGHRDALAKFLTDEDDHGELGFPQAKTVHFARVVILPAVELGAKERLAIETNYDGEEDDHVDDLIDALGPNLSRVLAHCEGYAATADGHAKRAFLRDHAVDSQTFYVGHQGFTRAQIVRNAAIRDALEAALDAHGKAGGDVDGASPAELRDAIVRRVRAAHPDLELTFEVPEGPSTREIVYEIVVHGVPFVVFLLCTWWIILPLLLVHEWIDARDTAPIPVDGSIADPEMNELLATEDWRPQNPLTHLSTVKPGLFRPFALRLVLFVIQRLARLYYAKGHLGDMWTIHFARWALLDDGRMLFFSNYDGSWESYLGDFVDKAAKGLSSIWSHTVGYPATHLLVWGGAKDEEAFKAWTRANQIPTQLWYTAYPKRSVFNVWSDQVIAKGLVSNDAADIRAMLGRL